MATHSQKPETHAVYFCTITCFRWLPLFEIADFYQSVYKWFDFLRSNRHSIIGYVIMPNHLHLLLFVAEGSPGINRIIGEGKRFMAYELIQRLKNLKQSDILNQLKDGVTEKEKLKGKRHMVFRLSFDGKLCYTDKMIEQKTALHAW